MRGTVPLLFLVIALLGACACVTPGTTGNQPSSSPTLLGTEPLVLRINDTRARWGSHWPYTSGLQLTPENTSGILPRGARFRWETTNGSFYYQGEPDFIVRELGANFTGTDEPVYWLDTSEGKVGEVVPVTITLGVWDPASGALLANTSFQFEVVNVGYIEHLD